MSVDLLGAAMSLADSMGDNGAQTSFRATIVTVAGTVLVALIGKITVFDRVRKHGKELETKTRLEVDLIKQRANLEKELKKKYDTIETLEGEITRLRDLCWANGVNPNVSAKFQNTGETDGHP